MKSILSNSMFLLNQNLKIKAREMFSDESGEVNIVAIVVLIGIAVLLALIFKDQIENLLTSMFSVITKNATDAVTN